MSDIGLIAPVELEGKIYVIPSKIESSGSDFKSDDQYCNILAGANEWIEMACDSATDSVKSRGGPFGAVLVQIDDKTGEVLRYWSTGNKVTLLKDPTAHAEILAIRSACKSLGTFKLSDINKRESKLPQKGNTSHCEIYSSCEPCPMCYSAIYWARIAVLYFAATRFDASSPGIDFSDKAIYEDLTKPYRDRKLIVKKCNSQNYNEAFILWQKTGHIEY